MIWILLVVYQIKHFLADYPLQGKYMLGKFKPYPDFVLPLMAHAGVHSLMTFGIAYAIRQDLRIAIMLGFFDGMIHFIVDRVKASPDLGGRFKALTKADFMIQMSKHNALKGQIAELSASQETIALAADKQAELNELEIEWNEKLKSNTFFWWSLGADQMAHHLTHYLLIYGMLS